MNKKFLCAAIFAGAALSVFGLTACAGGGKHSHTVSDTWNYDEYFHYHEASCGSVNHREDVGEHTGSRCFCGYGSNGEQGGGDSGALGVAVTDNGVLSFVPVSNAVKYVLDVTVSGNTISYDIDKSASVIDLETVTGGFPSGKTTVKLSAWELYRENIEGENIEQEVPMDGYAETFRIVKLNGKFSLVYLSYSDEYIKLDGFVKEATDEGLRFVYESALRDNKPTRFNVSTYAKAASGKTIKFYKTAEGRNNGDQSDEWSSFELPMLSINHGENKFYVRVTGEQTKDYDLCVYGLYELSVSRKSVSYTVSDGVREFTYTDLGSMNITERDIIPESMLYDGVGSGSIGRTNDYSVIERGDYIIEAESSDVTLYFYGENDVRSDCDDYASCGETFSITDNGNSMSLYVNRNIGDTAVVPYTVAGKAVYIANFNFSDVQTVAVAEGTKYYNARFQSCNALTDIYLPSTITDMSDFAFGSIPSTVTIHCAFSQETAQNFSGSKWNYITGQLNKKFNTVYDDSFSGGGSGSVAGLDIRDGNVYGVTEEFDGIIPDTFRGEWGSQPVTTIYDIHADGQEPYLGKLVIGKNINYIHPEAFKYRVESIEVKEGNSNYFVEGGVLYESRTGMPVLSSKDAEFCCIPSKERLGNNFMLYPAAYTSYNDEYPSIKVYVADAQLSEADFGDADVEYGMERYGTNNSVYLLDKAKREATLLKYYSDDTWIRGLDTLYMSGSSGQIKYKVVKAMPNSIYCPNMMQLNISAPFIPVFFDGYSGELPRTEEVRIENAVELTEEQLSRLSALKNLKSVEINETFDENYNVIENDKWAVSGSGGSIVYKLDGGVKSIAFVVPAVDGSVTIADGVTRIPAGAFRDRKLTQIYIPNSVTEIGEDAFRDCKGITGVTVPAGCAVKARAFYGCTKLSHVTFYGYCETEEDVFANCGKLTEIEVYGKQSEYKNDIKYTSDGKPAFTGMFRCLKGSYVKYVKSSGEVKAWSIEILYT